MGVSIDLHVYNRATLENEIHAFVEQEGGYRDGAVSAAEFLEIVGNEFGRLTDDEFMVVWNDYYEDYNPASNFLSAVGRYYFPDRDHDDEPTEEYKQRTGRDWYDMFFPHGYKTYSEGANSDEVLAELFPAEFGYGGTFNQYDDF